MESWFWNEKLKEATTISDSQKWTLRRLTSTFSDLLPMHRQFWANEGNHFIQTQSDVLKFALSKIR